MRQRICVTRALKNSRQIQAAAPDVLPKPEPLEGFSSLVPQTVLGHLHETLLTSDVEAQALMGRLAGRVRLARPSSKIQGALFSGELVFVNVTFDTGSARVAVDANDLSVAVAFAVSAVTPISRYASQFGPNRLTVSPNSVPLAVSVPGGKYNDRLLGSWVDGLLSQGKLSKDSCAVFLNPQGLVNTDARESLGVGGYHQISQLPYIFVNLVGTGLTAADPKDQFALALSHEIAEMTVDPQANGSNPEVCDPCGPNDQTAIRDYFDTSGTYLGSTTAFPPPYLYGFFLNAIVKPSAATQHPAPVSACAYAPP